MVLKWHIAQLITRVRLNNKELKSVWHILAYWALNRNESKIVRVNSLQGLFELSKKNVVLAHDYEKIKTALKREKIPSIQARIRKLDRISN